MIGLLRLVEAPATSLPYNDPAFPQRPLVLHAAPPRDFDTGTPVLFVHHGVRRNGRDYRDHWLDLVDEAGVLAFPSSSQFGRSPIICPTSSAICTIRRARPIHGSNGLSAWPKGYSMHCLRRASRPGNDTDCSAIQRAGSSYTECCRSVSATASPSRSLPMQAPTLCRIWRPLGRLASVKQMSMRMHYVGCSASRLR